MSDIFGPINTACRDVFGTAVIYQPAAGDSIAVTGILETGVRLEESAPGSGTYAILFLRSADLPAPPERGDQVDIAGTVYKVFEVEADAGGGVKLAMRLQ